MTNDKEEWITVDQAAEALGVSNRQANHLGTQGKIRTKRSGQYNRLLYNKADVETLQREREAARMPTPRPKPASKAELVPIDRYQEHVKSLEGELVRMARQIGQLEGELNASRFILEDSKQIRADLDAIRQERDQLRRELDEARSQSKKRPWWRRLLG